jgi:quinol monooxygenase YgiN
MLRLKPKPEKRQEILAILHSLEEPLNFRQNCLVSELYEHQDEVHSILYLEQWNSQEAMYEHIKSDLYLRILLVMEMAIEEPEIFISEVNPRQGMELIQRLRGCDDSISTSG